MPRPSAPAAAKKRRQKAGRPKKQNRTSKLDSAAGDDSDDSNVEDDDFEGMDGYKDGGYHPVKIGEVYNSRYRVVEKLGWGHFSTVWQCEDFIDGGRLVALKVQKSARHYTEAAADEISILDFVSEQADAAGQDVPVVRLLDTFQHDGPNGQHTCMVFELLGDNLLRLIKATRYRGVGTQTARALARRVMRALAFLHGPCGIIHTDIKPENVLLTHSVEDLPSSDQFRPLGSDATGAAEDDEADPTAAQDAGRPRGAGAHSASRSPEAGRRRHSVPAAASASAAPEAGVDFPESPADEAEWIDAALQGTSLSGRATKAARRKLRRRWAELRLQAAVAESKASKAEAAEAEAASAAAGKDGGSAGPETADASAAAAGAGSAATDAAAPDAASGAGEGGGAGSGPSSGEAARPGAGAAEASGPAAPGAAASKAPSSLLAPVSARSDALRDWPGTALWPLASAAAPPADNPWQLAMGIEAALLVTAEHPAPGGRAVAAAPAAPSPWGVVPLPSGAVVRRALLGTSVESAAATDVDALAGRCGALTASTPDEEEEAGDGAAPGVAPQVTVTLRVPAAVAAAAMASRHLVAAAAVWGGAPLDGDEDDDDDVLAAEALSDAAARRERSAGEAPTSELERAAPDAEGADSSAATGTGGSAAEGVEGSADGAGEGEESKEEAAAAVPPASADASSLETWTLLRPAGEPVRLGIATTSARLARAAAVGCGPVLAGVMILAADGSAAPTAAAAPAAPSATAAAVAPPPLPPAGPTTAAVAPPPLPPTAGKGRSPAAPAASAAALAPASLGILVRLRRVARCESDTVWKLSAELQGRAVEAAAWPLLLPAGAPPADTEALARAAEAGRAAVAGIAGGRALAAGAAVEALEWALPGLRVCPAQEPAEDEDGEDDEAEEPAAGSTGAAGTGSEADSFERRTLAALGIGSDDAAAGRRVRALGAPPGSAAVPTGPVDGPAAAARGASKGSAKRAAAAAAAARPDPTRGFVPEARRPGLRLWGRSLVFKPVSPGAVALPMGPSAVVALETRELDAVGCLSMRGFAAVVPGSSGDASSGRPLAVVPVARGVSHPDKVWQDDSVSGSVRWRPALDRVLLACSDVRWRNDGGRGCDDVIGRRRLAVAKQAWEFRVRQMGAVVVDLGNACWVDKHFTEDVQTRQYRAPEVTLGAGYDVSADVWSAGCMLFELLTGELLFDPRKGDADKRSGRPLWSREADHMAQIIELVGPVPRSAALAGERSGEYFDADGAIRAIPSLRFWGPAAVLHCKYRLPLPDARLAESFLLETLAFDPRHRIPAEEALTHPFVAGSKAAGLLARDMPEAWAWLEAGVQPDGSLSEEAQEELKPLEQPASAATRDTTDDEADEYGSDEEAGEEASDAEEANGQAGGRAGDDESEEELLAAAMTLVAPLGEEAVSRLRAGDSAEDITSDALWRDPPDGMSEAEATAAKKFTRLAMRALTGDSAAARRIKAAIEAGGPVGGVATAGVDVAREYVTLCMAQGAVAQEHPGATTE